VPDTRGRCRLDTGRESACGSGANETTIIGRGVAGPVQISPRRAFGTDSNTNPTAAHTSSTATDGIDGAETEKENAQYDKRLRD
jgi:hypothetical protein